MKPHEMSAYNVMPAASRDDRLKLYDGGRGNISLYIEEKISRIKKKCKK